MYIRKTALALIAAGIGLYGCGQDTPLETTDAVTTSEAVTAGKLTVGGGDAREDIGTQLGLTEEQEAALQALRESHKAAAQTLRKNLGRTKNREDATAQILRALPDLKKSLREGFRSSVDEILTEDQQARLDEIRAERQESARSKRPRGLRRGHRTGNGPGREAIADQLGLSNAQHEAVDALRAKHRAEAAALRESIGKSSDRDAVRAQMQALRDQHRSAFEELLTDEQKAQLEELRAAEEERQEEGRGAKPRRRGNRRR